MSLLVGFSLNPAGDAGSGMEERPAAGRWRRSGAEGSHSWFIGGSPIWDHLLRSSGETLTLLQAEEQAALRPVGSWRADRQPRLATLCNLDLGLRAGGWWCRHRPTPTHVYKVTHKKRHAMRIRDGRA